MCGDAVWVVQLSGGRIREVPEEFLEEARQVHKCEKRGSAPKVHCSVHEIAIKKLQSSEIGFFK